MVLAGSFERGDRGERGDDPWSEYLDIIENDEVVAIFMSSFGSWMVRPFLLVDGLKL